jgi:serine/threonine protein kinase
LKPENIFVGGGSAKLIDFGLATELGQGNEDSEPLDVDRGVGTPEYMAPELWDANHVVDRRADLYALGIIFYEMLCGAPPFFGSSADVQESHRSRRPVRLSSKLAIAPRDDAVLRCGQDPAKRFESVPVLKATLAIILAARGEANVFRRPAREDASPTARKIARASPRKRAVGLAFSNRMPAANGEIGADGAGGQLAQTSGAQYIAVFGHEVGRTRA